MITTITEEQEESIQRFLKLYLKLDNFNVFTVKHLEDQIRDAFTKLAYPDVYEWTYCIPLISSIEIEGDIVDLGFIMQTDNSISACIVHSNKPGDYSSGDCFWASRPTYKRLAMELLRFGILDEQVLINQFAEHNGLWKKFYMSNKADIWTTDENW